MNRENNQIYRENNQAYRESNQQESRDNINTKDFLIGTLIGGIVGAATALFMAPKSGKELRSDLNAQTTNLLDKTEKFRQTAMEKGTQIAGAAKDRSSSITDAVTNRSQDLMNKVKNMSNKDTGTELENDSHKYGLSNTADSISAVVPEDYTKTTDDGAAAGENGDTSGLSAGSTTDLGSDTLDRTGSSLYASGTAESDNSNTNKTASGTGSYTSAGGAAETESNTGPSSASGSTNAKGNSQENNSSSSQKY